MGACGAFFSLRVLVSKCIRTIGDDVFFVAIRNLFVIFLPGTACLYSGTFSRPSVSPEPSAARMPLLILWLSPTGYCCRERQNSLSVLEHTSSRVWFLYSNYYKIKEKPSAVRSRISSKLIFASCVGYFDLCMKQNKDAMWSLVLLLVTGVRADPKYSYSYEV